MDLAAKGDDFEKKAEKKLNGWGIFGSKYEDAADLFDKAANNFKLAKSCIASFLPFLLLFSFQINNSFSFLYLLGILLHHLSL
jgi:hypothetical protein